MRTMHSYPKATSEMQTEPPRANDLSELMQPEKKKLLVLSKRPPVFLLNVLGRVVRKHLLESFKWEEREDGRYATKMVWVQRAAYVEMYDSEGLTSSRWRICDRASFWMGLRTIWWLLWSTDASDEGGET